MIFICLKINSCVMGTKREDTASELPEHYCKSCRGRPHDWTSCTTLHQIIKHASISHSKCIFLYKIAVICYLDFEIIGPLLIHLLYDGNVLLSPTASGNSGQFFFFLRISFFFKDFIYLFLEREEGREKERERNINVWLPLTYPLLETWLATQACAWTGN